MSGFYGMVDLAEVRGPADARIDTGHFGAVGSHDPRVLEAAFAHGAHANHLIELNQEGPQMATVKGQGYSL